MHAVAANVHSGIQYKGIAFGQERAQILLQVPRDGLDIQEEPVYWVLPDGRCECWSVSELAEARDDELHQECEGELTNAYKSIAQAFGYHSLGTASNEDLEAFRNDPGTLENCHWD